MSKNASNCLRTACVCMALIAPAMAMGQSQQAAAKPMDGDKVVSIYPGAAPGSEGWTWKEIVTPLSWAGKSTRLIRNVVQPTLTIFNPTNHARANRTAMIIAPGGGNVWLAVDSEGYDVARALAAQGVTAMVLKYRLQHTTDSPAQFDKDIVAYGTAHADISVAPKVPQAEVSANAQADGLAAIAYVRAHAAELGVDSDRIGIIGFSAGGSVSSAAAYRFSDASRPDFVGIIYSAPPADTVWPANTPPVFLAVGAADFKEILKGELAAFNSLYESKHSVELHVYNEVGHGFGMDRLGQTSDMWFDQLTCWLGAQGLLTARHK